MKGRICVPAILRQTKENPELLDWLTSVAGQEFKTYSIHKDPENEDSGTIPLWP